MSPDAKTCGCLSCGGVFPDIDGPVHRYMKSSPGCWAVYGEVLAREYEDPYFFEVHRLTVDAYAVQHPGSTDRQSIQSVGGTPRPALPVPGERPFPGKGQRCNAGSRAEEALLQLVGAAFFDGSGNRGRCRKSGDRRGAQSDGAVLGANRLGGLVCASRHRQILASDQIPKVGRASRTTTEPTGPSYPKETHRPPAPPAG